MVIPTGAAKHGHVPLPWAIGHGIFGLFIFKGGQINFHSKTSSCLPWLATFPRNPSSGLNTMNCIHSVHPNCFLLKRVSLLKVPWEAMGLCATYTFSDLSSSTVSGFSISQVCGWYRHFILAPHQSLPLSLASTPQHHRLQLGSWVPLFFPVVTLALWPSLFSLPQPQGWCSDPSVWFSLKLLSALIFWPSWMGLLSQTLNTSWPMIGKPLILGVLTIEQDGLPWRPDYDFSYLVFRPGFLEYVSDQTSSPCTGWWGLVTSSISQCYSYLYTIMSPVFGGSWVVSLILRGCCPSLMAIGWSSLT